MTFTDIVNRVADLQDLTTTRALARIGVSVNEAYREVVAELRLLPTVVTANTVIGVQTVTFLGVEKLFNVYNPTNTPPSPLTLVSIDEMRNAVSAVDPATKYVPTIFGPTSVTIRINTTPTSIYALSADAGPNLTALSSTLVPQFSESFHNALTHFAESVELEKKEKLQAADRKRALYRGRIDDMKHYMTVSAGLRMRQGARVR